MSESESDIIFSKLLKYGYFPNKLDKILDSSSFEKFVLEANESALSGYIPSYNAAISYVVTKNDNTPRYFSIPYCLNYLRLCEHIRDNWDKISPLLPSKDRSMITIFFDNKNKRLVSMDSYDVGTTDKNVIISKNGITAKYFVEADISNFFGSIYSHAVCWAIAGKNPAKNSKKDNLWYNNLDELIRYCNSNESLGIAIGPDTSNLLSEIILSKVDSNLYNYKFVRHIDDYKCWCDDKKEAENFIQALCFNLNIYKLKLNSKKTKIIDQPHIINCSWIRKLRAYDISGKFRLKSKSLNKYDIEYILNYLDEAISLQKTDSQCHAIRYAVKSILKLSYSSKDNYKIILYKLLNICFNYPSVIDLLDEFLDQYESYMSLEDLKNILSLFFEQLVIDKEDLKGINSDIIVWSLYYHIKLDLDISNIDKLRTNVIATGDCLSILFIYIYDKIYTVDKDLSVEYSKFISKITSFGEYWLFLYEFCRIERSIELLPEEFKEKAYKSGVYDFFKILKKNNVSFLGKDILNKLKQ